MTRSAREAVAKAVMAVLNYREYELGDGDSILAKLAGDGWVMVRRELIENAASRLKITDHYSDGDLADAMLAASKDPTP